MTTVSGTTLRRRTVLAAAVAAIALAGAASARADPDPVDLKVVDRETGQALRVWRHHGRLFVAGEPGARYGLKVTNHTDGRVLLVMSVDGVNIVSGETAAYDQRGYVLPPHGSYEVDGWRKSNTEVAAFAFAPLPQSYAARTGRPGDVGVIGMAVFKERAAVRVPDIEAEPIQPQWRDRPSRGDSGPADAAKAFSIPAPASPSNQIAGRALESRQEEKLGTAHGAREWSVANLTTFERATPWPQCIRRIEYDTYANLVASGVIPLSPYGQHRPRPFPLGPDEAGFVPDPPIDP